MKHLSLPLLCFLGLLFRPMGGSTALAQSLNPYESIVKRNVFGLKPIPQVPVWKPPAPPLPSVMLTGITTIFGDKRALLELRIPPRPAQPAKEEYYTLSEGQGEGQLRVLKVNVKQAAVTVNICGAVMVLSFSNNAPKTAEPRARQLSQALPKLRKPEWLKFQTRQ